MSQPAPSDDEHWMGLALAQARDAAAAGEVPVGAVVIKDGQLIASGRNAPIAGHDPTAHAEIMALRQAASRLGNYRLDGCTLYVTLEPCAMCSGAMLHARLARVVFGAPDPRTGAAGSVLDLFADSRLNHQTRVSGGVCAQAGGQLLQDFFRTRRINPAPLREDALRTPDAAFVNWPVLPGHLLTASDWPELAGLRLSWHDTGPQDRADATLFVHGPEGAALVWADALAKAVASDQRALAVDLPGFGRSDKPKKEAFHTPGMHARILHALCQRSGLQHVRLVAPLAMTSLLDELKSLAPDLYTLAPAQSGQAVSRAVLASAFPDKGYRAGPQALARWTQQVRDSVRPSG